MIERSRRRLSRILRGEGGFTLLEALVALMIFSMIAAIVYSFLLMGTTMYKRISAETLLRSQANAVFASVIDELRGSIYVQQGASDKEISVVKWGETADQYIREYIYRFERLETGDPTDTTNREILRIRSAGQSEDVWNRAYGVTDRQFRMEGSFTVENQESLIVKLEFFRIGGNQTSMQEDVYIEIKQRIPLFRMK